MKVFIIQFALGPKVCFKKLRTQSSSNFSETDAAIINSWLEGTFEVAPSLGFCEFLLPLGADLSFETAQPLKGQLCFLNSSKVCVPTICYTAL